MLPAEDQALVAGSYNSADLRKTSPEPTPPATSTFPDRSRTPGAHRPVSMFPADVQVPVAGSNRSALVKAGLPPAVRPPATRTSPSASSTAEAPGMSSRPTRMLPVKAQVPVVGL
jgi:hypothetical protein